MISTQELRALAERASKLPMGSDGLALAEAVLAYLSGPKVGDTVVCCMEMGGTIQGRITMGRRYKVLAVSTDRERYHASRDDTHMVTVAIDDGTRHMLFYPSQVCSG